MRKMKHTALWYDIALDKLHLSVVLLSAPLLK